MRIALPALAAASLFVACPGASGPALVDEPAALAPLDAFEYLAPLPPELATLCSRALCESDAVCACAARDLGRAGRGDLVSAAILVVRHVEGRIEDHLAFETPTGWVIGPLLSSTRGGERGLRELGAIEGARLATRAPTPWVAVTSTTTSTRSDPGMNVREVASARTLTACRMNDAELVCVQVVIGHERSVTALDASGEPPPVDLYGAIGTTAWGVDAAITDEGLVTLVERTGTVPADMRAVLGRHTFADLARAGPALTRVVWRRPRGPAG